MKLPMIRMPKDYNGPQYQDVDKFLEWVVRDCAAIVATNHLVSGGPGPLFYAGWEAANSAASNAILARYDLEKEKP